MWHLRVRDGLAHCTAKRVGPLHLFGRMAITKALTDGAAHFMRERMDAQILDDLASREVGNILGEF